MDNNNINKQSTRRAEYYEKHRDAERQYYAEWYAKNKEAQLSKMKTKQTCPCGAIITAGNMSGHRKSRKHLSWAEPKPELIALN